MLYVAHIYIYIYIYIKKIYKYYSMAKLNHILTHNTHKQAQTHTDTHYIHIYKTCLQSMHITNPRRQARVLLYGLYKLLLVSVDDGADDVKVELLSLGPLLSEDQEEERCHQPSKANVEEAKCID